MCRTTMVMNFAGHKFRATPEIKAKWSTKAKVVEQHHTPRSYIIRTEEGQTLRRNRRDLLHTGEHFSKEYPNVEESQEVILKR